MGRVLFTLLFSVLLSTTAFAQANCQNFFESKQSQRRVYSKQELESLTPAERMVIALSSKDRFNAYFDTVNQYLKEREFVIEIIQIALLAREHVLLMGPPGNAKSMISDVILGNIKDAHSQKDSYYKIQMTPETTMSETHGPLDYVKLSSTSKYERIYEEGMLMSRNVFIDEIFDSRANALRNLLVLMNERAHAQGPRITKGEIETIIAATNRYISEVYETAGTDGPKAVIDRFAFSVFVPGDLEMTRSAIDLVQSAKRQKMQFPELTFQDLDAIRSLVPEVEIPENVAKFLVHLRSRMKEDTEAREESGLRSYREKLKNGETPAPPYRATKYQSPRTLNKAGGILKALVVYEWLKSGGTRPLRATLEDVRKLELFFTLNGPRPEFIEQEISRAVNEHEKVQLMSIKQERETFQTYFDQINNEVNTVVYGYSLMKLQEKVETLKTPQEKEEFSKDLIEMYVEVFNRKLSQEKLTDLTGEQIGLETVELYLVQTLRDLLGTEYNRIVGSQIEQINLQKQKAIRDAEIKERERIAQEQRAERERLALEAREQFEREQAAQKDAEIVKIFESVGEPEAMGTASYTAMSIGKVPGEKNSYIFFDASKGELYRKTESSVTRLSGKNINSPFSFLLHESFEYFKVLTPERILVARDNTFYIINISNQTIVADFALSRGLSVARTYYDPSSQSLYILDSLQNRIVVHNAETGARTKEMTISNKEILSEFREGLDQITVRNNTLYVTSNYGQNLFKYSLDGTMKQSVEKISNSESGHVLFTDKKVYIFDNFKTAENNRTTSVKITIRDLETGSTRETKLNYESDNYEKQDPLNNVAVINDTYLVYGGSNGLHIMSLASGKHLASEAFNVRESVYGIELKGETLFILTRENGDETQKAITLPEELFK